MQSSLQLKPRIEDYAFSDLLSYAVLQWPQYRVAAHHRVIADALQRVERGDIKRLMIFVPPRHGKSMLASEYFPAWYLGRNPYSQIIHVTYAKDLALDFGRKVRNQLNDETIYPYVFEGVRLADDSAASDRFHTNKRGVYHAVGVGGAITGRGADLLLIDDPIKGREDADSELYRRRMRDWYQAVAYTRLMPGGSIVLIQTRWRYDDLGGLLLDEHKDENWHVISMPAIDINGQALWPEAFPIETLHKIKAAVGSRDWNALYQQQPTPDEGGMVKLSWFGRYDHNDIPSRFDRIVHSWDTAQKSKEINDPTAGLVFGQIGNQSFLLDVIRERMEYPELKRRVIHTATHGQYPASVVLIEDKASGISLAQELRQSPGFPPVIALKVEGDKELRMHRATPTIEAGNIFLPSRARWLPEFESEIVAFPLGKTKDQGDALSQYITWAFVPRSRAVVSGTRVFSNCRV